MNTTTKRLLAQSGLQAYYDDQEGQIEKLIELVIKEAIKTVQSVGDKASNDIPFEVTDLFVSQLRQRFGVQE